MAPLGYPVGNQPAIQNSSKYRNLIHDRDYEREKRNYHILSSMEPAGMSLVTQPMHTYGGGYLAYRYLTSKLSNKVNVDRFFTIDNIYNFTKKAEQRLPVFRIALRSSQVGDLMSPFVSNKALKWKYSGSEVIQGSGKWEPSFDSIRQSILKNRKFKSIGYGENDISHMIYKHGLEFEKTGAIYGNIFTRDIKSGKKVQLLDDVFIMERARAGSQFSGLSSLWEASRRTAQPFQALDQDHWFIKGAKRTLGPKLTPELETKLRRAGGFAKNYLGDYFMEYIRAMNRFLKEPVPFVDRLLGTEKVTTLLKSDTKDPLEKTLNKFLGTDRMQTIQRIPFGKLHEILRPYVSSESIQKSPLKMLGALSAKGAFYVKGLPALYFAADSIRRKFDQPGMEALSGPLFAAMGVGAGSLIKTNLVKKWSKHLPITKSQLAGGVIGGAIGLLPTFNKGIGAGFASLFARYNIAGSKLWDAVGGQESLRRQEDLFPGLTNPMTGVGFVMAGGILSYLHREVGTVKSIVGTRFGYQSQFFKNMTSELPGVLKAVDAANQLATIDPVDLSPRQKQQIQKAQNLFTNLFKKYQNIEPISRFASITEAKNILEGQLTGKAPKSQAGLLALVMKNRLKYDPSALAERLKVTTGAEQFSEVLFRNAEAISGQMFEDDLNKRLSGMSRARGLFERFKSTLFSKTPSLGRGAARGGLAFAGLSMLGAAVAGPMGGNFSPIDLVPGWLIRLTGGGKSAKETEDIFTGRKEVAIRKGRGWAMGRCCLATARIQTGFNEFTHAEDITYENQLIDDEGYTQNILNIWQRDYTGKALKIYTALDRNEPIEVTPNHIIPVLKFTGNYSLTKYKYLLDQVFLEAGNLKKRDFLRITVPRLSQTCEEIDLTKLDLSGNQLILNDSIVSAQFNWFTKKLQKAPSAIPIPSKLALDKELAYFLGVFIAEGNLSFNNTTNSPSVIETTHNIKENYIFERIQDYFKQLGINTRLERRRGDCVRLRACHSLFASVIFNLCYHNNKGSCKNKVVPNCIFDAPNNIKESFVQGWFDGDGHIDRASNCISTCSSSLKDSLKILLLSLGYCPRVPKKETKYEYTSPSGTYTGEFTKYRISWNQKSQDKEVAYFHRRNNYLYVAISSIEEIDYKGHVYDFEIDSVNHLISCNSLLIHNSPFEGTKVMYHRKHRAVLMQSDAKVNALYGSRKEMEAYSPILNPIGAILDPEFFYHRDIRMSQISPTPLTSRLFSDVPILGEVLASTVGEVIKPTRAIRPSEWMTGSTSTLGGFFTNQKVQAPPGHLEFQNMGQAPPVKSLGGKTDYDAQFQSSLGYMSKWTFERLSDQAGLRGFMFTTALEQFGYKTRNYQPVIERGETLFSNRESFWSMNLGDPLGTCFTGDTLVNTISGRKPIKDIQIGDSVLSLDGTFKKVIDKLIVLEHDKELIEIDIDIFGTSICSTDNHWFPVLPVTRRHPESRDPTIHSLEYLDVQAKDIQLGDYLIIPIIKENLNLVNIPSLLDKVSIYFYASNLNKIPNSIKFLSRELTESFLLGYLKDTHINKLEFKSLEDALTIWKLLLKVKILTKIEIAGLDTYKLKIINYYHISNKSITETPLICKGNIPLISENKLFIPVTTIYHKTHSEPVYDLTIEDLHYYCVEQVAVHNTEALRRYLPQDKNEYYNPLKNLAPSWLPSQDYFRKFDRGNYFCLGSDTIVELGNLQFCHADEVHDNDLLISVDGSITIAEHVVALPPVETLKIKISKAPAFPITCTKEHPFAVRKLMKGRNRRAPISLFIHSNKLLTVLKNNPGFSKTELAELANISLPRACACWHLLQKHKKIAKLKHKRDIPVLIDNELFDERLLKSGIVFTEAKDLKVGDYVAYPKPKLKETIEYLDLNLLGGWSAVTENYVYFGRSQNSADYLEFIKNESFIKPDEISKTLRDNKQRDLKSNNIRRYPRYIKLDYNFGEFVGLWCAEGWEFGTAHHKSEKDKVIEIYKNVGVNGTWRPSKDHNGACMTFHSLPISKALVYLCGKKAREKKLNELFAYAPREFLEGFLRGYVYGDGCNFKNGNRSITQVSTASKILALQVQKIFMLLGKVTSIVYTKPQKIFNKITGKYINSNGLWTVILYNSSKSNTWFEDDSFYFFRINEISLARIETVFAYQTESDTFCVLNAATHNSKVNEGYLRLPGRGFETLNPEVRGIHPENYSDPWKYKVLSDVAYNSNEWQFVKEQVIQGLQAGKFTAREKEVISETNRQLKERSLKQVFRKYQFDEQKLKKVSLDVTAVFSDGSFSVSQFGERPVKLGGVDISFAALAREAMQRENLDTMAAAERLAKDRQAEIVDKIRDTIKPGGQVTAYVSASETDIYGNPATQVFIPGLNKDLVSMGAEITNDDFAASVRYNSAQKFFGRAWETFTHNLDLPITPALALNSILPFQPQSKYIGRLTPTELYARTKVYGRDIQMWQRYKEDFIDSAMYETTAKILGDFIPRKVAYRRTLMEYFDKLTWVKNFMLESAARKAGNKQAIEFFASKKRQTLFGADPYKGFSDVWRALPSSERDYYRDFVSETDETERNKILSLVPESVKHLYIAQWQNRDIKALSNKIDAGMATDAEERNLYALYNLRRVEGMNWSHKLQKEYERETAGSDVKYADWMRLKQLSQYFKHFKMPGPNYVGFNPQTSLEDVKLQVAKNESIDIHDLGLWGSREASIQNKPYVIEAAAELEDWEEAQSAGQFEANIRKQIQGLASVISVVPLPMGTPNKIVMAAQNTRTEEIKRLFSGYGEI